MHAIFQLRPFSQAIMEACLKASNKVNTETSAANPDFKKILDSQPALRGGNERISCARDTDEPLATIAAQKCAIIRNSISKCLSCSGDPCTRSRSLVQARAR